MSYQSDLARAKQRASLAIELLDPALFESGTRRDAARMIFSALTHLEGLAVEAAARGNGIRGQLEDELFHQMLFAEAASRLGGLIEPTPELSELVRFIVGLSGAESLAILNLISEGWLDTVFRGLIEGGFCAAMLTAVEADEARHTDAAYDAARDVAYEARPTTDSVVRDLESVLFGFAETLEWVAPLTYLVGHRVAARIAIEAARRHEAACKHLGVQANVRRLVVNARALYVAEPAPRRMLMSAWEVSKMIAAGGSEARIVESRWMPVPSPDTKRNEALIVQAASRALDFHPRLNRTIRASALYTPRSPWIGVRRVRSKAMRDIITVYSRAPHRRPVEVVMRELSRRAARARREPDADAARLRGFRPLEAMLPPPGAAVVVSNCHPYGLRKPEAWLVPCEGVSASLTIGRFEPLGFHANGVEHGRVHLNVACDHRAWDAAEAGEFVSAVESFMEAAT